MKITVRYALLAYSIDLTTAAAESIPVAVIATGDFSETAGFVFLGAQTDRVEAAQDPFGVVRQLPDFLDTKIQEGLRENRPGQLLEWLQPKLRQSLSLRPTQTLLVETNDRDALLNELMGIFTRLVPASNPHDESTPASFPSVRFTPVSTHA